MPEKEKKTMTESDAARIQSHADRTATNQDFKSRAQGAAAKNSSDTAGKPEGKTGVKQGR